MESLRMLSPNLASLLSLQYGKYLTWAAPRLNADSLEGLLWTIGEFANRCKELTSPDSQLPEPVFHNSKPREFWYQTSP